MRLYMYIYIYSCVIKIQIFEHTQCTCISDYKLLCLCLSQVHHSYEEAQKEIALLKQAQSLYEENMKKAFMRGVCALNTEAMSMFQGSHTSHPMPVNHMVQPTNQEIPESVHFPSHTKHQSHDRHMTIKLDSTNSKGGGKKHSKGPAITVERHVPVKS